MLDNLSIFRNSTHPPSNTLKTSNWETLQTELPTDEAWTQGMFTSLQVETFANIAPAPLFYVTWYFNAEITGGHWENQRHHISWLGIFPCILKPRGFRTKCDRSGREAHGAPTSFGVKQGFFLRAFLLLNIGKCRIPNWKEDLTKKAQL